MRNKRLVFFVMAILFSLPGRSQFLMDMVDTSKDIGKGMLSIYHKFDHIRIGGYIQPQFQLAASKGVKNYSGGDFADKVNNRFMLRRGRIRFDYVHFTAHNGPSYQFVFQFDGTERGVFIRDFWGRIFENRLQLFAVTAGMFARPFGYELNLSSSDRESPERGRMSQILMKTERDLGVMISIDPRKKSYLLKDFKFEAGLFNGQGLAAAGDYDSHKDFISRLSLKPVSLTKKILLSGSMSYLNGGFIQNTRYVNKISEVNGNRLYVVDSAMLNEGKIAPRKYYGADMQVRFKTKPGAIELRGEFIGGKQTATQVSSETPAALLTGTTGYYIRNFNGAYFYVLGNVFNTHHQLGVKYDWYDPNTQVSGNDIGKPGTNLNAADIRYGTLSVGYNYYMNANVKLMLWYDFVQNEKTLLPGYTSDIKDDIFTCRLQFRF